MSQFKRLRKPLLDIARRLLGRRSFTSSDAYWEQRYQDGGNSGAGSYGKFAEFKADVLNRFVAEHSIRSVIEFGCGDGNQLLLAKYPQYVGVDVSQTAIAKCRHLFATDKSKVFVPAQEYDGQRAELALSLDVIYHLVEDGVFERYMHDLLQSAERFVIIYSSDMEDSTAYQGTHVRLRAFSKWIEETAKEWELVTRIPNRYPFKGDYNEGSWSDFFIYRRLSEKARR